MLSSYPGDGELIPISRKNPLLDQPGQENSTFRKLSGPSFVRQMKEALMSNMRKTFAGSSTSGQACKPRNSRP
jgi:hypothetical protein